MLDLMTLGLSVGAQQELEKARETHGAQLNQEQNAAETASTTTSASSSAIEQAAEVVGIICPYNYRYFISYAMLSIVIHNTVKFVL